MSCVSVPFCGRSVCGRDNISSSNGIVLVRELKPKQIGNRRRDVLGTALVRVPPRLDHAAHEDNGHMTIELIDAAVAGTAHGRVHVNLALEHDAQVRGARLVKRVLE